MSEEMDRCNCGGHFVDVVDYDFDEIYVLCERCLSEEKTKAWNS